MKWKDHSQVSSAHTRSNHMKLPFFLRQKWLKINNLMKFNIIILSGLRPQFKEAPTGAMAPTACWRGMAAADYQHLHKDCFQGSSFPGAHSFLWNTFMWLETSGQFGKFPDDICVIPQIPSLVDSKGKSIWVGHILDGECSWQGLPLKFSLKQTLLSLGSFWEIHVNFLLNPWWRRLITSLPPPSQPCFARTCLEWNKLSLNPDLHPTGESYKGRGWVRLFEACFLELTDYWCCQLMRT